MTVKQCPAPFTDLQPHPELAGYWIAPDGTLLIDTDGDYVDPETMEKYPPVLQERIRNDPCWDLSDEEWREEEEGWDRFFEALGITI